MTAEELIVDLSGRIDRGIAGMEAMAQDAARNPHKYIRDDSLRLASKAQGLRIVKDWLRSYTNVNVPSRTENVDSPNA